jgi:uncharacterized protein (TIGR03067 family)
MRKMFFSGVAVVSLFFALLIFVPRQVRGQVDAAEMKKFQGTWKMVSAEMDGKKVKDENVKKCVVIFTGEKVKLFTPHQHKDTIISMITKLDLSKDPRVIYWLRDTGPNAGKTMPAIYKFDGPDNLQVCFDPAMTTVPGKFDTDAGSGHIWHTWKRVK